MLITPMPSTVLKKYFHMPQFKQKTVNVYSIKLGLCDSAIDHKGENCAT